MLRFRLPAASEIALLSSLAFVSLAVAQDEPLFVGSVEVASAKATKVRELRTLLDGDFDGAWAAFDPPKGKAFLVLNLELKPTFGKTADGEELVRAEPQAVSLKVDGAELAWPIGTCSPHGVFEAYASGYYGYPTEQPRTFGYDPVFVVPEGATKATLTLGGTTHPVTMPADVATSIDPAQAVQIKVDDARTLTSLTRKQELGTYEHEEGEFVQRVVSSAGRFAAISVVLKPKFRNQPLGYGIEKTAFGLLLGKEVYVEPAGFLTVREFSSYADGFYFEQDALGEFNAGQATLVFPLPGAVKSGKLLYFGAPVADVTFGD